MFISDGLERFLAALGNAGANKVLEEFIFDRVRAEGRLAEHVLAAAIRGGAAISGLEVQAPAEHLAAIQADRGARIVVRADYAKGFVLVLGQGGQGNLAG